MNNSKMTLMLDALKTIAEPVEAEKLPVAEVIQILKNCELIAAEAVAYAEENQ